MQNVINALLNFWLISIPEEFVWVLLCLIQLKRHDLVDTYRWKENIKWLALPTVLTAISINIFIYIIPNFVLKFFIPLIMLFISLKYILEKTNYIEDSIKWYKIIIAIVFGMIAITLTEMVYVPLMLGLSNESLELINANIWVKFLMTLPVKIFQIFLVYFIYYKSMIFEKKYMSNIFKDKVLSIVTVIFVSLVLFVLASAVKWMSSSNIFNELSTIIRIMISILFTTIPTILIFLYIIPINYLLSKMFGLQQSYQHMLDDIDV